MGRMMVAATAAAVAVGMAGCGASEAPLTSAQFTHRAEAVCVDAARHFLASGRKLEARSLSVARKKALYLDLLRAVIKDELEALEDLTPPAKFETAFADYRETIARRADLQIQRAGRKLSALTEKAHRRDLEENRKASRLLAKLRLKRCT